jgi:crotonobetainyl-CoA:carnitine CoA-transferase CaiB-like acyl-CoA transferase
MGERGRLSQLAVAEVGAQRLPLAGVRVLDLSNLLAGPMGTMYLADFGAEVIKVEHPERGDELRHWGHSKDGVGLYFKVLNRNKKLITLNLGAVRGQELARRIVADVDVVVENYRPGTMERWGLGWDELHRINQQLIMVRVTGFGQTGPYRARPGFGTNAEAFSGAASITGYPDRPPLLPAFGLGDSTTGIHAAFGVMVALHHRDLHGGGGQFIDLGLYEGLFSLLGPQVIDYDQLGVVQERQGSRLPFIAPRNTYRTRDNQWVAIAATQAVFERLAPALDAGHLVTDPRFTSNQLRIANASSLDEELQAAVATLTLAEVLQRCEEAGAAVAPAHDIRGIFEDPHFRARENVIAVKDEELGEVRMQNVVPRLSATPGRVSHAGLERGASNREIYVDRLGLSEEELRALEDERVV